MQHIPINVSIISTFAENSDQKLVFIGDETYYHTLRDSLSTDVKKRLNNIDIELIGSKDSFDAFIKSIKLVRHINSILSAKSGHIVLLTTTSGLLLAQSFFHKNLQVSYFIHMLLSRVERKFSYSISSLWAIKAALRVFNHSGWNKKLYVLEEHIKDNILNTHLVSSQKVKVILHPINQSEALEVSSLLKKNHDVVCFPGVFSQVKGAEDFNTIIAKGPHKITFSINGRVPEEETYKVLKGYKNLILHGEQGQISRDIFIKNLDAATFLFIGHDEAIYKWCSSGVYLDALARLVPIIAKRSTFFENEFERYGNMGLLYDDIDEVCAFLETGQYHAFYEQYIVAVKSARYARMKSYCESFKEELLYR
jgi:hypothetical protein